MKPKRRSAIPRCERTGLPSAASRNAALPADLPRIEVTLEPDDKACPCCRATMIVIGEDSSERLDKTPAQYRVIVTKRPKLACRACPGTVVQEPAPPRLIEGGIPTEALVAQVVVARFADHQPLYRQAQMMAREGVIIERSTLSFWIGYAAAEVAPVVDRLREMLLASSRIFVDETVVPVLDPGRGRTKKGYFWAIARDDRPWGGSTPPAVVYTYAPGRGHIHADALLGGYRGILQCDGYAAYKKFAGPARDAQKVTLVFCWSHVRRGFYDLAKTGTSPIATEALKRIAALYEIEARVRGDTPYARHAMRQAESRPLVADLRRWFEAQLAKLPARSTTADAINYALNHWDGLARFLDDGRIDLDTNAVERAIRPVILSRKNSLFAGSDEGGVNWSCWASLIETCKLNGVNPLTYITELLTRLVNGWPQDRIDELMPWHWAPPANRPLTAQGPGTTLTVERGDTRQHFRRKRRLRRRVELEEAAPHMGPTECQADRLIGAIAGQALEAVIAVHLQHAVEAGEVLGRPRVLAVLGIDIGHGRVGRTAPWPVIDRIAPEKPRLGPPAAGIEHRQAGVVGKDLRRRQHRGDHQVVERRQPPARGANPIAQRRAIQRDALARQHLRLPIQRQGIAEFADDDMHDQRFGRHAAIDRPCRRLGDNNRLLAASAGVTRPARHPDPQLRRRDVELLGAQFADAVHVAAAARARLMRDIDHHLVARQMRRQCAVIASGRVGARSRLRRPPAGSAASCAAWCSATVCS